MRVCVSIWMLPRMLRPRKVDDHIPWVRACSCRAAPAGGPSAPGMPTAITSAVPMSEEEDDAIDDDEELMLMLERQKEVSCCLDLLLSAQNR